MLTSDKTVGVSVEDFLSRFWPILSGHALRSVPPKNPFRQVASLVANGATENVIAKAFAKAINDYALTPGLAARTCTHRTDGDGTVLRVDGAFYRDNNPDAPVPRNGAPRLEDQMVAIEFKTGGKSNDPFPDDGDTCAEMPSRKEALRQIVTYAEQTFTVQHRTAWFLLFVNGSQCRIIRWDRSGVVFTHSFDYCIGWQLFCEVLWRMSRCSDEQLGLDPTARRIHRSDPLYKMMDKMAKKRRSDLDHNLVDAIIPLDKYPPSRPVIYKYVRALFKTSLSRNAPRYILNVPDGDKIRQYLVGRPIFVAKGALGRATLGFAALDRETRQFVWLKDCWRVDYPGVEPEGKILRELNRAKVPNVPTVVCYGDLLGQKTVSPETWGWAAKLASKDSNSKVNLAVRTPGQLRKVSTAGDDAATLAPTFNTNRSLRLHQHARMVVEEIALPLRDFKSGLDLLTVIHDCLNAHSAAVREPTSRLHRDISGSNIMMIPKFIREDDGGFIVLRGLLCDWELSKRIDSTRPRAPRQPVRSGTWQFMSATLLNHHDKAAEICDDLEAFFHVILYYAVRYLKSNLTQKQVGEFIDEYYDQFQYYDKWRCGQRKQAVLQSGLLLTGDPINITFGSPMDGLFATLLPWFQGNHIVQEYKASLEEASSPNSPTVVFSLPPAQPHALFHKRQRLLFGSSKKRRRADSAGTDDSFADDSSTDDSEFDDDLYNPSADVASPSASQLRARAPTAEESNNAAKVQTHKAFMTTIKRLCRGTKAAYWPHDRDPSGDRYPKDKTHGGID